MNTSKTMLSRVLQATLPFAAVLLLALTMVVVTSATATRPPTSRDTAQPGLPAGQLAPILSDETHPAQPAQLQFDFNS